MTRSSILSVSHAAALDAGANYNTISFSTMISNSANRYGLYVMASSSNAVFNSYIQGTTAAFVSGSTGTAISASMLAATNTAGSALALGDGSVNFTLTTSTVRGGATGMGIYLDRGNSGLIALTSNTVSGGSRGVSLGAMSCGAMTCDGNLSISSMIFSGGLTAGATAIDFTGGDFISTFAYVSFADANIGANVNASPLAATSRIAMRSESGGKRGTAYEDDPVGVVDWEDGYPGCATARNVGAGQAYPTITLGLAALPTTLTGHSCVVIRDGATYAEQVTVAGFTNNGSSITIFADPDSGLRPVVSPPALSTAAFLIANASVNIQGIDVVVAQDVPYGVWASSGYASLTRVSVSTSGGLGIYAAAVRVSSWTTIDSSTITAWNAYGLWLDASARMDTVGRSTIQTNSASFAALYLSGASSCTITQSYLANPAGSAATLDTGSHYNTISQSTVVADGVAASALYLLGSDSNTLTGNMVFGGQGNALYLAAGSDYNTVSLSTLAATATNRTALFLDAATNNTIQLVYAQSLGGSGGYVSNASNFSAIRQSTFVSVTSGYYGLLFDNANFSDISDSSIRNPNGTALQIYGVRDTVSRTTMTAGDYGLFLVAAETVAVYDSYIQGSTAAFVNFSTGTSFGGSVLAATSSIGSALALAGGSVNLTITTSTLRAPSSGRGLALNYGSVGLVSLGSVTFTGAARGIEISTQGALFSLAVDSITFRGLASGATAVHFLGGTFVATFTLANFEDASVGANVSAAALDAASRVTMNAQFGVRAGPDYENDPAGLVYWSGYEPYPGCVATNNVGIGKPYATISAALAALPGTLTGHTCVIIQDGRTYAEQVTVRNFVNNGSSLTIMADPASGLTPVVSPPAQSTAAFLIANASVSIQGIAVVIDQSVPYGVWASSAYVDLSSVSVSTNGSLGIYTAGVRISSWSAISYSSVSVWGAHGFWLDGSTRTTVSFSTALNRSNGAHALFLDGGANNAFTTIVASNSFGVAFYSSGSDTNTVTQSFLWGATYGVNLQNGSDYNAISLSTMTGNSTYGFHAQGSDSNTVTQSYMWGGSRGASFLGGADYSAISLSTMIGLASYGINIQNSDSNSVTQSHMWGGLIGVRLFSSVEYTVISLSTMIGNTSNGLFAQGGDSNTVTQSYIQGGDRGAFLTSGSECNAITLSTMIGSAAYGLYATNSDSNVVTLSSMWGGRGGALLDLGADYNIIGFSTIASDNANDPGLYLLGAASNTIADSYVQGSTAAVISGSTGTMISRSVFVATSTTGSALVLSTGSVGLALSSSTLTAPSLGRGLALGEGNVGVVSLGSVTFTGAARGIEIVAQGALFSLAVDSITFRALAQGATAVHFLGGTFVATITLANFESANLGTNVSAAALDGASRLTMNASFGSRAGPAYENDPASLVDWQGYEAYPGCVVASNVGAGRVFTTIQAGVDALPVSLTGHSCVVIRDGATYAEQVTVRNFVNNGSSITILAAPGFAPVVSPPAASTAAFLIANASVNIQGLSVLADQSIPYGIWSSSGYVTLSSVAVSTNGSLGIYEAGVRISSWSAISYSSVTVWNAHAVWLDGSTMTTIGYSTAVNNSETRYAVYLDHARNSAFTVSFASNSSLNGSGIFLSNAGTNTVTQSSAWGGGSGVRLTAGSEYNTFSFSTMIAKTGVNPYGLWMLASDSNTVANCYLRVRGRRFGWISVPTTTASASAP